MIEKVNPCHPDKVADRIAGAIVDLAYTKNDNPKCAVEVLLGHSKCTIIAETSEDITLEEVKPIVERIAGIDNVDFNCVKQDPILAGNQDGAIRCGDNGIFKGVPLTDEERKLSALAREIFKAYPTDGKYIYDAKVGKVIICQSNARTRDLKKKYKGAIVNPLGDWTGGSFDYLYDQPRSCSEYEIKCVCSFPQDYQYNNKSQLLFLTGMSVPPIMTAQIANQIYEQWLSKI